MATLHPNLVITGFMGTGKTTAGCMVADLTGMRFVDTDAEIEKIAGMKVARIFAERGETFFRDMERSLCRALSPPLGLVVATGGGTMLDPANAAALSANAMVVCLHADPKELECRLDPDAGDRPLLNGDWPKLLERRRPVYAALGHTIDTGGKSPALVSEEIVALWKNEFQ